MRAHIGFLAIAACTPLPPGAPAARGPANAPEGVPVERKSAGAIMGELPMQVWAPLDGHAVGLLVNVRSPYGTMMSWGPSLADVGARDNGYPPVYWFATAGESPRALYFQSTPGVGENFLPSWSVPLRDGGTGTYDAAMYGPATPNHWGLAADAHLVDVEVNGGQGAAAGLHFVATDVRVLDGSADFPIQPAHVLADARARFDALLADEAHAMDDALAGARRDAGTLAGDPQPVAQEGLFPTWMPAEQRLRVLFVRRQGVVYTRTEMRYRSYPCKKYPVPDEQGLPQLPGGRMAPCPPPHDEPYTVSVPLLVEIGALYEYDAQGALRGLTVYTPAALPVPAPDTTGGVDPGY